MNIQSVVARSLDLTSGSPPISPLNGSKLRPKGLKRIKVLVGSQRRKQAQE